MKNSVFEKLKKIVDFRKTYAPDTLDFPIQITRSERIEYVKAINKRGFNYPSFCLTNFQGIPLTDDKVTDDSQRCSGYFDFQWMSNGK